MTNDLFSITCTTCKTRLKVREESAIGQILACPKCGGMVMVRPPEGWQKGQPLPAASLEQPAGITTVVELPRRPEETLGDSQFDDIDDLLSDAPPRIKPSSVSVAADAPGLARPRFVGAPPPIPTAPAAPAGSTPALPPAGHAAADALQHANGAARSPTSLPTGEGSAIGRKLVTGPQTEAASPPATATEVSSDLPKPPPPAEIDQLPIAAAVESPGSLRYWLMMAGSVVAGIALALAVVVGMIWFFRGEARAIVQATPSATPVSEVAAAAARAVSPQTPAEHGSLAPSPVEKPAPALPAPAPAETPPPAEHQQPAESPAEPTEPAPPPADEGDPLGLTNQPPPPPSPASSKDPLAKFDTLIAGDHADPLTRPEETADPMPAPPAEPDPALTEPIRPALPRPLPREVNVAARLADPLQGIETTGTPLADFLQVISDLSTIPITLETEGLPLVNVTPETPVALDAATTTIGGALTQALAPLKLESIQADGHLLIRVAEPPELPTLGFPAKDLTDGDETRMAELAEAIQALVAPDAWNAAEGGGSITPNAAKGTLDIRQTRAAHAQLLVAFEKLRMARKLPYVTGTRYNTALFSLATRGSQAQPRLTQAVSLTFAQPTPFVRILKQLEEAAKVRILIDWQALAAAGWNADGEATLVADKQPLAAALDALLEPMDLAWRVIDGRTVEVTTPQRLADELELEFYKVDDLTTDDPSGGALIAKIQAALGESLFREAGGSCALRYDEPGQCLLASLPQPKQAEVERHLAKLRDETPAK